MQNTGEQMSKIRLTVLNAFVVCMVVAALVVPVLAGQDRDARDDRDDRESGNRHVPTHDVSPAATPAPQQTTVPPPVTTAGTTPSPATTAPVPATVTPVHTVPPTAPATPASTPGSISLTGAQVATVTSSRITSGAMIHHADYTDVQGNVWGGIPLWYLLGFADDTIGSPAGSHGSATFNDTAAAAGYTVTVTGRGGNSASFPGRTVARNESYIIATTLNGVSLAASDPAAPYRLTGAGVTVAESIDGVIAISLVFGPASPGPVPTPTNLPEPPNGTPSVTPTAVPTGTPAITPALPADAATTLALSGAVSRTITQTYFATGVSAGHHAAWNDSQGNAWDGMPLWYLAGMVDDGIQHGPGAFSDTLASAGYTITVTGRDGTKVTLDSRNVSRSPAYIVANRKNGIPIPYTDPSAPFALVGSGAGIGSGVQGIAAISVTSAPGSPVTIVPTPTQPVTTVPTASPTTVVPASTDIRLSGAQSVTITPAYFARGASIHAGTYTDSQGIAWGGVPLWYLAGFADDTTGSASGHGSGAFNDGLADTGYTITVSGSSGSVTLDSKMVKRSSGYLIANTKGGSPCAYTLVGSGAGIGSGVQGVSGISLNLGGLTPTPTPTVSPTITSNQTAVSTWNISVEGKMDKVVTRSWFEGGVAAGHAGTWQDTDQKTWRGIPLWYFAGLSDDSMQHGSGAFSDAAAADGYTITVYGKDGKNVELDSGEVARSDSYLVANWLNGAPIPVSDEHAPVALVGEGIGSSQVIGGVERIVLSFKDTSGTNATTTDKGTADGDPGRKTPDGDSSGSSSGSKDDSDGFTVPTLIPTFTFRIAFTPFPELLIQYGHPALNGAAASTGITTGENTTDDDARSPAGTDTLDLSGAINDSVTVRKIQDGIVYGHAAEYTDAEGNTWAGMPLWFFAGWVDDGNAHSAGAFNDDIARAGYNITVTGSNGETVIAGMDAMRSDGFLIATTKNGERLTAESDGPLMLVGNSVPPEYQVNAVSRIALDLPATG